MAESLFNKHTTLTDKQEEQFRALAVLWLECNNCTFSFYPKDLEDTEHSGQVAEMQANRYVLFTTSPLLVCRRKYIVVIEDIFSVDTRSGKYQ